MFYSYPGSGFRNEAVPMERERFLSKLIVSRFKGNKHFKLLNVTHNRAALFVSCIIELQKYSNNIECSWIFRDTI